MKQYYRSNNDRVIAGVCGGLAQTLKIDSLTLRILFVVAAMINGIGLFAYLALWLFMAPEQSSFGSQDELIRHNVDEMRGRASALGQDVQGAFQGRWTNKGGSSGGLYMVMGVVLVGIGLMSLLRNLGWLGWMGRFMLPLGLVALGAVLLLNNLRNK